MSKRIEQLMAVGIEPKQIIVDVGIGCGKTSQHNLELMQHLDQFRKLNLPLLVDYSRKSVGRLSTDETNTQKDMLTLINSCYLTNRVDYLRVHNVKAHAQALTQWQTWSQRVDT